MLAHKTYLSKFKITEIIQYLFLDHNRIKSESNRKIAGEFQNSWRLKEHTAKKTCESKKKPQKKF